MKTKRSDEIKHLDFDLSISDVMSLHNHAWTNESPAYQKQPIGFDFKQLKKELKMSTFLMERLSTFSTEELYEKLKNRIAELENNSDFMNIPRFKGVILDYKRNTSYVNKLWVAKAITEEVYRLKMMDTLITLGWRV